MVSYFLKRGWLTAISKFIAFHKKARVRLLRLKYQENIQIRLYACRMFQILFNSQSLAKKFLGHGSLISHFCVIRSRI